MRQFLANSLFEIAVRARKSPWIETSQTAHFPGTGWSGLVRARGLKLHIWLPVLAMPVRARKSPWIETSRSGATIRRTMSGLVRARGLKQRKIYPVGAGARQGS